MNNLSGIKKYKRLLTLSIVLAFLVPALVTATVVISYTYNTSTSGANQQIYLASGPNYPIAASLGLVSSSYSTVGTYIPATSGTSATTVTIDTVAGSSSVTLLNVFEIVNSSNLQSKTVVTVTISSSLPNGVTLYYTTGALATATDLGTSVGSNAVSFILPPNPASANTDAYLSISIDTPTAYGSSGTVTGSFTISFTVSSS